MGPGNFENQVTMGKVSSAPYTFTITSVHCGQSGPSVYLLKLSEHSLCSCEMKETCVSMCGVKVMVTLPIPQCL